MMLQNLGIDPSFQMPQPDMGGGMFGGGDSKWKNALMAAVAGFMARRSPQVAGNLIGGLQDAQIMKQKMAQAAAERQQNMADQKDLIAYKAQFDSPAPHYFESNSGDQYAIGPDGKPVEVFHDPMRYKFVPNGMGGVVPVDISALMSGQQPVQPVGKITPIGGPTPSASGGFL